MQSMIHKEKNEPIFVIVLVAVLFNKDQIISHSSEVFETQCSTDLKERRPAVLDNFLFSL